MLYYVNVVFSRAHPDKVLKQKYENRRWNDIKLTSDTSDPGTKGFHFLGNRLVRPCPGGFYTLIVGGYGVRNGIEIGMGPLNHHLTKFMKINLPQQ